jgi:hypothetical protein
LDALLPELAEPGRSESEAIEALAVHPRVLEVELEDSWEWAMTCWFDPGSEELADQLTMMIVATLLAEMSTPPAALKVERNFSAVRLLVFAELSAESRAAIERLGFKSAPYVGDEYVERMAAWRDEARAAGTHIGSKPDEIFVLEVVRDDPAISAKLDEIQRRMVEDLGDEVWGETPGGPSRLMATYFRQYLNSSVTPSHEGLRAFELFLSQEKTDVLRWMPPVLFQGLCDFVGVILQAEYEFEAQWGLCATDETGFTPPPLLRVSTDAGFEIVPVGEFLVEWCIMPRGDDAAQLADYLDELVEELR